MAHFISVTLAVSGEVRFINLDYVVSINPNKEKKFLYKGKGADSGSDYDVNTIVFSDGSVMYIEPLNMEHEWFEIIKTI
ncbi:MAG: hypothetical protein MJ237_05965 [bacterium]|nr:hypothetical protein [bacterium]